MPNSNTSPQALQGASPIVHSREDEHAYTRLRHLDDVIAYTQRNYDASLARAEGLSDPTARLWRDAAAAFGAALQEMQSLGGRDDSETFSRAKELLHHANHLADEAEASSEWEEPTLTPGG